MGCGIVELRFIETGHSEFVSFSSLYNYHLADGSRLHVIQQVAWCRDCGRFVLAEYLPSIEELQEELAGYRSGDREWIERWVFVSDGKPVAIRIAELKRYREWRLTRQSPPRCLECGMTDITPSPMDREFPHPATGEHLVVGTNGFTTTPSQPAEYSPEGERLVVD